MDTTGGVFTSYPTMSSGQGELARDNQQQSSSNYSQRRISHARSFFFFVFVLPVTVRCMLQAELKLFVKTLLTKCKSLFRTYH